MLDINYWDIRHKTEDTPWDIGYPAPAISGYTDQVKDKNLKVLIPGAGLAHEALYLAESGWSDITVCDFSQTAIEKSRKNLEGWSAIKFLVHDFFELEGQFDLIIEQTFFCALDPHMRSRYVEKMYELLVPGGKLAGLLFNKYFDKPGPPFGGDMHEYMHLFSQKFYIKRMEPCLKSITPRMDSELFFICVKSTI